MAGRARAADVPVQMCPACGYVVDDASQVNGDGRPRPGDVAVCISCAEPGLYDERLMIRLPDADEAATLAADATIAHVQAAIRVVNLMRPRPAKQRGRA